MLFDVRNCPRCLCMRYQLAFSFCISHSLCIKFFIFFRFAYFSNDISSLWFFFFISLLWQNATFICSMYWNWIVTSIFFLLFLLVRWMEMEMKIHLIQLMWNKKFHRLTLGAVRSVGWVASQYLIFYSAEIEKKKKKYNDKNSGVYLYSMIIDCWICKQQPM